MKCSSWISIVIICTVASAVLGFVCEFRGKPHRHHPVISNQVDQPEPTPPSLVYHWGYIDKSGIFVIRPRFERAYEMRNGYGQVLGNGAVSDGHIYTVIDRNGNLHLRQLRSTEKPSIAGFQLEPGWFQEDSLKTRTLLSFSSRGQYGFVDANEQIVIPAKYDFTSKFHENICAVQIGDQWGYIDERGNQVIKMPTNVCQCGDFSDGMAPVAVGATGFAHQAGRGARWGFIDKSGRFVISPQFVVPRSWELPAFHEGLAKVGVEENRLIKYGFINPAGKFVIKPIFNDVNDFSEGLAPVSIGPIEFVPDEWKLHPTERLDMLEKFFQSYRVVGMPIGKLHQLLGTPEEYNSKRFGKTIDPCESFLVQSTRCSACWVFFQFKDGCVTRYSKGGIGQGRSCRWTSDGTSPTDTICPKHHYGDYVQLSDTDVATCGKCNFQF